MTKTNIEGLNQRIEFLKSCIKERQSNRSQDIQSLALARRNNVNNCFGKHPDDFIKELTEEIKECEGKILALQFAEGQKTYRVNYQRSFLGISEMGSTLVTAHSAELAMQMVKGATSVKEQTSVKERGLNDLRDQISQLAEFIEW